MSNNRTTYKRTVRHPLDEQPAIYGTGPRTGDTPLALIGDMPTEYDTPITGPFNPDSRIGKFLHWGLATAEIYRPRLWLTNLTSRRAPSGDDTHPNWQDALAAEQETFRDEVRHLVQRRGLKAAVLMGYHTLKAFGITSPVASVRGSVYVFNVRTWQEATRQSDNTILLIPTYHPAYLTRNRWTKSGKGRADYAAVWLDDLTKAKKVSAEGWHPPVERFNITPTYDDVKAYVQDRIQNNDLVAVDIETTGFSADNAKVVCIGLAQSAEDALVVPFLDYGGRSYWPNDIGRLVRNELIRLFANVPLMFQNALFDVPFLNGRGFTCPMTSVHHDTLLLHHAVSPELPHKLGFIVSQYGDTPYWKDEFANRQTTILKMDQTVLRTYNARDCVVLHQVLPGLLEDLHEIGAQDVYEKESIALLPAIEEMMSTGVVFDTNVRDALRWRLEGEVESMETELRTLASLPDAFNIGSDDDLRLLLFGEVSSKYDKGEDYGKKKEGTKVRQQLKDLYDVRHATSPMYQPKGFKGRRTDTGKLAINKQGRLSYQRHLDRRLADINRLKRPTPAHVAEKAAIELTLRWMSTYQSYTELKKILSTYMDYPVGDDGRVHTKFIVHGTATGRLASRDPNLQNLPKRRSKDIRRMFVAPDGHYIVAADYANLEVKVMAYETQDPILIDIVDNGRNMHDLNTQVLFGLTPDDPMWEPARRASKIFMFGSLAYGGGDNEIYEKVILDVPELHLTFNEFVQAKQRYMSSHPVYTQWRDNVSEQVRRTRRVENAFGRVRTFYGNDRDIVKEGLNFPIQSAAASIINRATVGIYHRLHTGGYRTRLQAQIHDELRLEVPEDELNDVIRLLHEEMEKPVDFHGIQRTFNIEVEYGRNWADLEGEDE